MAYSDYTTALTAFVASPSEETKAAVIAARAALPDTVQGEGGLITLPNLSTLDTTLSGTLSGLARTDRKRLIRTGLTHG